MHPPRRGASAPAVFVSDDPAEFKADTGLAHWVGAQRRGFPRLWP